MARCEGCNMFASVELREPDDTPEVTGDDESPVEGVTITASFELVLETQCCSMDGGTATAELDGDVEITHTEGCEGSSLSDNLTVEGDDYYEPAGRPARYQRHHYGVKVTGRINCESCGASSEDVDLSAYEQASNFEAY